MRLGIKTLIALGICGLGVAGLGLQARQGHAADHLDPPTRTDPMNGGSDRAADIADLYAWHRSEGTTQRLVTVLTFAGPNAPTPTQRMSCDRDVLYNILIDNTGDARPDLTISARMGTDDRMNCFVQWTGLPGTTGPVVTPAEHMRTFGDVKVYAGLRDDPFFFDLQGFRDTLAAAGNSTTPAGIGGTRGIRMTNDRDFFAGKNSSALVIEMPLTAATGSATRLKIWATTARIR